MKIPVGSARSLHPQKRNSSSCLPYEGSPHTTCSISWVLPHFVPFSWTARSLWFSWYITSQQNNSGEGLKSSWAFGFYACISLIPWYHFLSGWLSSLPLALICLSYFSSLASRSYIVRLHSFSLCGILFWLGGYHRLLCLEQDQEKWHLNSAYCRAMSSTRSGYR